MAASVLPHGEDGATSASPILEVNGLRRVYGGTVALADGSLTVRKGEVHALLGENGAGKSTLVRIIAGIEQADGGTVKIGGDDVSDSISPRVLASLGCAFIHQELALVDDLSVGENVALTAGFARRRSGLIDWRETRRRASDALARLGVDLDPEKPVATLSIASRAVVAIARALAQDARFIVLDEPTANLQHPEAAELLGMLRSLADDGVASLLITHRLDEVLSSCDRITVLRNGRTVDESPVMGLRRDDMIELITGHTVAAPTTPAAASSDEVALSLRDVHVGHVGPLSIEQTRGEIVGLTGFADSGHLLIADALFGVEPLVAGQVLLDGASYVPSRPREAICRGVSYVPRDRAKSGVASELTLRENLFMHPNQPSWRRIRGADEERQARDLLIEFGVRPPEPGRQLSTLSGGNQQRVLLAKWLHRTPRLLVLSEPTAAVDIGAKAEIYQHLRASYTRSGTSILVASSDFDEIAELCDRAIVLHKGRLVAELSAENLTPEEVSRAAFGYADEEAMTI